MSIEIGGLNEGIAALQREHQRSRSASAYVYYTAEYALPVHERLDVYHPVGQAKFLEEPLRTRQKDISDVIYETYEKGGTLLQSVYVGGLLLQRLSMELCPVDTGNLRASAATRSELDA